MLRNDTEERSYHLRRGKNLKSRINLCGNTSSGTSNAVKRRSYIASSGTSDTFEI